MGPVSGLSAPFLKDLNLGDLGFFVNGFNHVVDGQGCGACGGERFHLDPGNSACFNAYLDAYGLLKPLEIYGDLS